MNNIIVVTPQNIMPPSDGGKKCMYSHILSLYEYNDNTFLAMGNIDEKNIVFNGNRLVLDKAKTTDHCRNAE